MTADSKGMLRIRNALVAVTTATLCAGMFALPADAAPSPSTPAVAPSNLTYTVKPGDYLKGIASKLGVALPDLLSVNSIAVTAVIHPGDALIVPAGGTLPATPTAPAAAPLTYTVKSGDFLFGIAGKLGVSIGQLLATNKLTLTSVVHPGMALTVPAGGKLPVDAPATPAPNPQAPTTASAQSAGARPYTIVAGDFLMGIAVKNGVTLKALLAANGITISSTILPGKTLSLPPQTLPIPAAIPQPATANAQASNSSQPTSIATVLAFLNAQVGKPYQFNSAGPDSYDCSGLVTAAYKQISINLPHQSLLQSLKGTPIDFTKQPIQAGDLIFQYSSAQPTVISHVGIAMSSTTWIQAAGTGKPVKIGPIPSANKIVAVRRIVTS